jgi:hypothetical protein
MISTGEFRRSTVSFWPLLAWHVLRLIADTRTNWGFPQPIRPDREEDDQRYQSEAFR